MKTCIGYVDSVELARVRSGAGDLAHQLYNNGGNINCVNWWEVGSWALTGSGVGMVARSGLGVASFFYNARSFSSISRAYWLARGGAAGMSLDHWAISQAAARSGPVSSGVVNAGWNLLEMDGLYRSQRRDGDADERSEAQHACGHGWAWTRAERGIYWACCVEPEL